MNAIHRRRRALFFNRRDDQNKEDKHKRTKTNMVLGTLNYKTLDIILTLILQDEEKFCMWRRY